jgi:hypothetical protein
MIIASDSLLTGRHREEVADSDSDQTEKETEIEIVALSERLGERDSEISIE